MDLLNIQVNYWAILVGALFHMVLGYFWYSPYLFGKQWMELMNISPERINQTRNQGMAKFYAAQFLASIVKVWVLSIFINLIVIFNFWGGVVIGLLAFIGFVFTTELGGLLWEGKSWKLLAINMGYHAITLGVIGGILSVWY